MRSVMSLLYPGPESQLLTHWAHQFGYLLFLGLLKCLGEQNGGSQCLPMPFAIRNKGKSFKQHKQK